MTIQQAINLTETRLKNELRRAARLAERNFSEGWKRDHFNCGYWSGNREGIKLAIEKLQEIKRYVS